MAEQAHLNPQGKKLPHEALSVVLGTSALNPSQEEKRGKATRLLLCGRHRLPRAPRKKDPIAVRIRNDECASAPWLGFKLLLKDHTSRLKFEEEWLCILEDDGSREQMFSLAKFRIDGGFVEMPEIQPGAIPYHLSIERWIAIRECNCEP
jgi:hypothetical protein